MLIQGYRGGSGQRDALVGRAKQGIEGDPGVLDGGGVEAAQAGQMLAGIEQPGIEEIGADPPGLEGELTKAKYLILDGELDELPFVILHDDPRDTIGKEAHCSSVVVCSPTAVRG